MYRTKKITKTSIKQNTAYTAETIEQKVDRILNNKEPIKDGAPLIYSERQDGVLAEYNPRTDRFDVAIDAADKITKTNIAKRKQRIEERMKQNTQTDDIGKAEPTQGTK